MQLIDPQAEWSAHSQTAGAFGDRDWSSEGIIAVVGKLTAYQPHFSLYDSYLFHGT